MRIVVVSFSLAEGASPIGALVQTAFESTDHKYQLDVFRQLYDASLQPENLASDLFIVEGGSNVKVTANMIRGIFSQHPRTPILVFQNEDLLLQGSSIREAEKEFIDAGARRILDDTRYFRYDLFSAAGLEMPVVTHELNASQVLIPSGHILFSPFTQRAYLLDKNVQIEGVEGLEGIESEVDEAQEEHGLEPFSAPLKRIMFSLTGGPLAKTLEQRNPLTERNRIAKHLKDFKSVELSAEEGKIIQVFQEQLGKRISAEDIIRKTYKPPFTPRPAHLSSVIGNLRKKLATLLENQNFAPQNPEEYIPGNVDFGFALRQEPAQLQHTVDFLNGLLREETPEVDEDTRGLNDGVPNNLDDGP